MEENNYFFVSFQKEKYDYQHLIEMIKEEGWIDKDTIIVNCFPDYSSILCQMVNHKLSYLNDNQLFDQITLEFPYPIMNQIFNRETGDYQLFDKYLQEWMIKYVIPGNKYLFLSSFIETGTNFSKLLSLLNKRLPIEDIRVGTAYLEKHSKFIPDYKAVEYNSLETGELVYEWENVNNPNWKFKIKSTHNEQSNERT